MRPSHRGNDPGGVGRWDRFLQCRYTEAILQVQTFHTSDAFDALKPEWNALLKQSASDALFLTWEFQATWWRHLRDGDDLRLITVRDADGGLIGIAPVYGLRTDGDCIALRLIGGVEVADYLDFIAARGCEREVLRAIFEALCAMPDWRLLDLRNVPAASPTRALLPALAAERGFAVEERVEEVCPVVALPETFDAYLDSLDKKQRHEIRRKIRKAHNEAAVSWHVVGAEHDLTTAMNDFIDLHQRSAHYKDDFMTPDMQNYFRALAQQMQSAGWLELAFIEIHGTRAASYFNFVYNDETLCYNSGYDPEAYAVLSPGIVLLSTLIDHSIQQKRKRFDFLQGNEVYKYRMGAADTQVYQLTVQRPSQS